MKFRPIFLLSLIFLVASCGGNDTPITPEPPAPVLRVMTSSLSFEGEGGIDDITFNTNTNWTVSSDVDWVKFSPGSGIGLDTDQGIKITVGSNNGPARNGKITIKAGTLSQDVQVSQKEGKDDGIKSVTISQFKALKDDEVTWYRLTGVIISISKETYGDMYIYDDTGQLYVYGMAPEKDGANEDFHTLGLKAGDRVTFVAHRKTYNGVDETDKAYYERHTSGSYPGFTASSTKAGWLELPATSDSDGLVFISHLNDNGTRNFSVYFDKEARVSRWSCYPYVYKQGGTGRNNDPYAYDPLIGTEFQADLTKSYQDRTINGVEYVRGHMTPSNDRSGRANYDLFLSTNIMPQSSTLNSSVWGSIEITMHDKWSKNCDTVYVVTGTYFEKDKEMYVTDNSVEKLKIRVPNGIYKAFLAHTTGGDYHAMGVYFDNVNNSNKDFKKDMSISIDQLEEKVGVDLFVNLPDDIEKRVEAEKPSETSLWW